ncbi:hypothetical protein SteCoe_21876 [Stentor coeruleus]|uniref:Uncharacterized protein n=1 Tax=Stentor coeruleus TaxID=5963 RepID=A0A1R2BNH1_9CILI|nr:hypothetical protein SteCoe_31140 [Stentor coeruleus]OMJ78321.1 hypothetical protein SteCoe_21876 [Stentor coeruleus]
MSGHYKQLDKRVFIFKNDLRKRKTETLIMKKFFTVKDYNSNPKKEYVRCKVIRGHKKMIRNIIDNKFPTKGIIKINSKDKKQLQIYRFFQDHYADHTSELDEVSKTESGPLTDGKARRDYSKVKLDTENSFNNKFCKEYFTSQAVRESFCIFIELVFSKIDPEDLNEKFGFSCCQRRLHNLDCYDKWMILKFYLQDEMFATLDYCKPEINIESNDLLPSISSIFELDGLDSESYEGNLELAICSIKHEEEKKEEETRLVFQ